MKVEMAIHERVSGLAPVTALVSTRVYLDKLQQSPTYPCVRVLLIDDLGSYHLRGPDGLFRSRVQVDAFAREDSGLDPYQIASDVADAIDGDGAGDVATGLSGFVGVIGGSPYFQVLGCFRVDRRRQYDPDELNVVTVSQDYEVSYRP